MTDMSAISENSFDAIFSSHNVEHLYPHDVERAFSEFYRVLNDSGFLVIACPDLKSVATLIAEDKLFEPAYISPAGPIAPIDILYGYRPSLELGNLFMAHKTGFTEKSLVEALRASGFPMIASTVVPSAFACWVCASKSKRTPIEMRELALAHFPPPLETK